MIEYADRPGCISDGETPEEAIANGRDAVAAYIASCEKHGDPVPLPSCASGQWRQRVPRSLHSRLVSRAQEEGVGLNTLVTTRMRRADGRFHRILWVRM